MRIYIPILRHTAPRILPDIFCAFQVIRFRNIAVSENIHLCIGFITIWWDVKQKNADETSLNKSARSEPKINNDLTTEAQNIISMINNMSGKYNEVKQVLETYHNNFTRIATDFESISRIITSLQSEMGHSIGQS